MSVRNMQVHVEIFQEHPVYLIRPATSLCTAHFSVSMAKLDYLNFDENFIEFWAWQQRLQQLYSEIAEGKPRDERSGHTA